MVKTVQVHAAHCGPDSDSIEALAELLDKAENEIAAVKDEFRHEYNVLMDEVRSSSSAANFTLVRAGSARLTWRCYCDAIPLCNDQEDMVTRDLEMFISRMASPAWDEVPPMEASSSKQAKAVHTPVTRYPAGKAMFP